jgi:hypothetical protein
LNDRVPLADLRGPIFLIERISEPVRAPDPDPDPQILRTIVFGTALFRAYYLDETQKGRQDSQWQTHSRFANSLTVFSQEIFAFLPFKEGSFGNQIK